MTSAASVVAALSTAEVTAVVDGRLRLGDTQAEQVAIWNAAIDRENGYDL